MARLTKRTIDAAEPPTYDPDTKTGERDYFLWDDDLEGFGLRVFASGRKSFLVQYRAKGRTRRLSLGKYGVLTAAQARSLARERLGRVAAGEDPAEEKREGRDGPTVADLVARFLKEHVEAKRKARTTKEYRRLCELFILPQLGQRKVNDLDLAAVDRLHRSLSATPYQANRVLAVLSAALSLAEKWGWRAYHSNPCMHVERYKEKARDRFLTSEELERLGGVLKEAEGTEPLPALLAVRLLVLTGCRLNEILQLRWDEVDFAHGCFRFSDSKTGAKVTPVGSAVLELLAKAPRVEGNPYVLPGRKDGKHFVGLPKVWGRLRKLAGLDDVRLHDLRHSYAAVGVSGGHSMPIVGRLLGHTQSATTERYAHLADDPVSRAAGRISDEIAASLAAGTASVN